MGFKEIREAWVETHDHSSTVIERLVLTKELLLGGRANIRSQNFGSGTTGFKLDYDGSAEFNDVTVRGTVQTAASPDARWEINTTDWNKLLAYTGISTEEGPAYVYIVGTGPTVDISETEMGLYGVQMHATNKPPSITIEADVDDGGGPDYTHTIALSNVDDIWLGGGSVWKTTATTHILGNLILPVKTDTGDPTSPTEGQIYVNTSDNKVRVYADAAWRDLATW